MDHSVAPHGNTAREIIHLIHVQTLGGELLTRTLWQILALLIVSDGGATEGSKLRTHGIDSNILPAICGCKLASKADDSVL